MPMESVDLLIAELEKLKIQEACVVAQLKQARKQERCQRSSTAAETEEEVF